MRAIVTGATGFLGKHVVQSLTDKGWQVFALGRNSVVGKSLEAGNVCFREVDIHSQKAVEQCFEEMCADKIGVVFHCAALSSAWGAYQDFYRTNVEGTRHLVNAAERYAVTRFIYVSSTSVYFDFNDQRDIRENKVLPKTFVNAYAETKFLGEQEVLKKRSVMETVIIRPRGIVGEGDTSIMPRILRVANKGWFPLLRKGNAEIDITYVKNVVAALILAAEKPDAVGEVFNISNDEPMTVKELLNKVFDRSDIHSKLVSLPYRVVMVVALMMETFGRLFRTGEPLLTQYGVGLLSVTQTLNIEKAKTRLNYSPAYSIDDAVDSYLHWKEETCA